MAKQKMTDDKLSALLSGEITSAVNYDSSDLSQRRVKALEYYQGILHDVPHMPGRSSVTSRDLADTMGWMLPGYMRVFTASDQFGVYEPQTQADEEFAEQASDYANFIFWRDNHGYRIIYSAAHDSMLHGNGIGKIWWDSTEESETSEHTGLNELQLVQLMADADVEVLAQDEGEPQSVLDESGAEMPIPTIDVKIKRIQSSGRIRIVTVAPEDFLMDKDAKTIEEARFTAHRQEVTRSQLIEMGFDRGDVGELPADGINEWREESIVRDEGQLDYSAQTERSEETVELFECYIKADVDDDGISETVKAYYAGNSGAGKLLEWEVCDDDNPFFDLPCEPVPHRWEARSVADDTMDIQRVKTALIRQTLDNLYASNLPMADIEEGSVKNMQALVNPQFGGVIQRKKGSQPINWGQVPFVAGDSLQAIQFFDSVIEKRTGVSRTTMALDPEALQNQTATANQNAKDAAYSQIELIARNHAELGWKVMFKKMLRLLVKHQDRPRTIRLRDEWVEIDPRHWNAHMDVNINVGLGTGSRDRDMQMLQLVQQNQKMLVDYAAGAGEADIAIEMLPKVLYSMRKMAESAGLRDVDALYPDITPEQVEELKAKMVEKAAQQPVDPKVQLEQQKAQADMQMKQAQMQHDAQRDAAQMELDKQKAAADIEAKRVQGEQEIALKQDQMAAEMGLKREQLNAELLLKREQLTAELALKRELGALNAAAKVDAAATSNVHIGGDPG